MPCWVVGSNNGITQACYTAASEGTAVGASLRADVGNELCHCRSSATVMPRINVECQGLKLAATVLSDGGAPATTNAEGSHRRVG